MRTALKTSAVSSGGNPPDGARPAPRRDIQGLRTVAVGLVIIYHLWPELLPGGFVGVDVFLVISGYLIVGSLVREIQATGRLNMGEFYSRRIRRLLPAATLVLLTTLVAAVIVLPQSRWQPIALDVIMSALQLQNWNQAFSTGTYEGATALVSPVQHFWSLAVEEQFYLLIPLLLASVAYWRWVPGKSLQRRCLNFFIGLSAVSLVHSIALSQTHHDVAYFATTTRMWELGFGGILALTKFSPLLSHTWRRLLGWAGLAALAAAALAFSTQLAFPGYVALLPVLGTCALILVGEDSRAGAPAPRGVTGLLSTGPFTWLGDISYSLYLWHWPVIVFFVHIAGRSPQAVDGVLLVALSVALAAGSYRWVEQPFRRGTRFSWFRDAMTAKGRHLSRGRTAYALGASLIVTTTLVAAVPWAAMEIKFSGIERTLNIRQYPGALAMDPASRIDPPRGLPVQPDPTVALKDVPLTAAGDCGVFDPSKQNAHSCVYGPANADKVMIVVGDSHAAQFVDPLVLAGESSGWKVHAMVRNGCPFSSAPPESEQVVFRGCSDQNEVTLGMILDQKPELVVVSGMHPEGYAKDLKWHWAGPGSLARGYVDLVGRLRAQGVRVAVIPDIPFPDRSVPDCVAAVGNDHSCSVPARDGERHEDPLRRTALDLEGVELLDLDPYLCRDGTCPAVLGNVLVYRDNHLTNTFAKTLARPLATMLGL